MSYRYGFIGGGNMAAAILGGVLKQGLCPPDEIMVSDVSEDRLGFLAEEFGVAATRENAEVVKQSRCVVLAVKPQVLNEVAPPVAGMLSPEKTVVSILAGVRLALLQEVLGGHERLVRVMPNLPATIGKGVTAVAETTTTPPEALHEAETLLATVGDVVRVNEDLMDAVTAVSGSGPGYLFRFAEIFIEAGVEAGLSEEQATVLVKKTFQGAGELLAGSEESAAELCRRVCSPGGTTLAGLERMDQEGLAEAIRKGILAARDRSVELSNPG